MTAIRPETIPRAQRLALIRQSEELLKRQPRNVSAHFNIALLLKANNQTKEAIEHLKKARKLKPNDLEITTMLAETCFDSDQYILARKIGREMIDKFPTNLNCRIFMGDVLEKMGKPEQAIIHYKFVLAREPDHQGALSRMSVAMRMAGKTEELRDNLKSIDKVDNLNPYMIFEEAYSRKFDEKERDELDEKIETVLKGTGEKRVISNMYFAKGKIADDVGLYDFASQAFKHANSDVNIENYGNMRVQIENSRAVFTKEFFNLRKQYGDSSARPVFIVGMPRSGTTLVESLLSSHSLVTPGDELEYVAKIGNQLGDSSPNPLAFQEKMESLSKSEVGKLAQLYLEETSPLRVHRPYFTDKLPHNFLLLGLIYLLLPKASIIHCRRHPIDCCLSLYTNSMTSYHNTYKCDLTRLGLYYRQYWQLMQHWRENIPGGFHEVFYEDVVANTELNARKMIEHIGLEWEDSVMDRQKSQKSVKTLSAWQVRQPVYTSSAGRWKNYEKHLGPLIDALGPVVEEYENELKALGE